MSDSVNVFCRDGEMRPEQDYCMLQLTDCTSTLKRSLEN